MSRALFILLLMTVAAACEALADGGVVRAREAKGPFIVTVFTPPDLSTAAAADVTVMVQERDTGEVVLNADVRLRFTPPAGARIPADAGYCGPTKNVLVLPLTNPAGKPPVIRATRANAANRLLYGANVVLPAAGDWQMQTTVAGARGTAIVDATFAVGPPPRRLMAILPWLAIPPIAIALFAFNQALRRRPE